MTQNLKNFIEEFKEDRKCTGRDCRHETSENHYFVSDNDFISLIKMIVEMVESEKKELNTKSLLANMLSGELSLLEEAEKVQKINKDYGFNQALDTISSKLKELIKE